ncbi:MAG TPA: hypothetical protein PKK26_13060, partial [Candidatus Wallbacteria bacterium]|nr:hypothetical protein [Candidatus Wallbacteria bacterium]
RYKAQRDCDMVAEVIRKYNSLEGSMVKSPDMNELAGKYIVNLKTLRDMWGNPYEHDARAGMVFSRGPDGKHDAGNLSAAENSDDIVSYYGARGQLK